MIFKRTKSVLNKILDNYTSLFEQWEKKYFNDGSIDEITYVKNNMKIIAIIPLIHLPPLWPYFHYRYLTIINNSYIKLDKG